MACMDANLPPLIEALLEPPRYPHPVQQVELVQTHISWLLLAGEFAYKIKKPLKLPFLDYSTLAQRKACCEEELRLNRRYAPDLYLDVVGVTHTPQDPQLGGPGEPIEYGVKMRRFDESGRLDRVCVRGELRASHLSELADAVVAFHRVAQAAPTGSRFGSATEVMSQAQDNFHDLRQMLGNPDSQRRLAALQAWTQAQFDKLGALMQARKAAGRVRECHGDLHLANLVLTGGKVTMFDCIEFNEDLRWIDVASEIAFTYVDLLAHQRPGLAGWFVNEVLSRSGDYESVQVVQFYAVYRALVRAKVAAIRGQQVADAADQANAYLTMAERLITPRPLRLVITHGVTGCGKTFITDRLLQRAPYASTLRLRSDVERKRLHGLESADRSGSAIESGIYTAAGHARTYTHLRELAAMLLHAGWSVIVDAAFLKRADRASFRALALDAGADFSILAPQATPEQLRQRIEARAAHGLDASEGSLEVLELQLRTTEPLADDEQ